MKRYAYCMYNPLRYIDPSGWAMKPSNSRPDDPPGLGHYRPGIYNPTDSESAWLVRLPDVDVITPNPASTWAAIDYTLPAGATKATFTLTNALGVAVMTAELNGNQGQKVLDLRPLAAGVYGYSVRCREHVMNGKIVVTK